MTLLILITSRYYVDQAGVWTTTSYDYSMWAECLDSWDHVVVAAPCLHQSPPVGASRADGPGVSFVQLRDSFGALGALLATPERFFRLRRPIRECDALVLHVPDIILTPARVWAGWYSKPYALDVRGAPTLEASYLRLRGVIAPRFAAGLARQIFDWVRHSAVSAIYVSTELKDQLSLGAERPMWVLSDTRLPDWWFTGPRDYEDHTGPWRLCVVGRLDVGKGLNYLLDACAWIIQQIGRCLTLDLVGSGPAEAALRRQAESLGIADLVVFRGRIPWGPELHEFYCGADLFVMPSLSEGGPRVVLEAMACGLAVVSTEVGCVSEVLVREDRVPAGDTDALGSKLLEVLADPARLGEMSRRNYARIQDFRIEKMRAGKQEYYRYLRSLADRHRSWRLASAEYE